MLISKEELKFDFGAARFKPEIEEDRKTLGWVFNQFLYGEITGIQCGHWLYHAPHLGAAAFLAKQAQEELSHVKKILRILSLLHEKPAPAHPIIKFLSTGMMGGSWGEHVALEMALGEGLVLSVFYAMEDTIDHPEIRRILTSATVEEERHVEFGERETMKWLEKYPGTRKILLAQAYIQVIALKQFKKFILNKFLQKSAGNEVLAQFEKFYDHVIQMFELRIEKLGLARKPLSELTWFEKLDLILFLPLRKLARKLTFKTKQSLLTSSYLEDPALLAEEQQFRPS